MTSKVQEDIYNWLKRKSWGRLAILILILAVLMFAVWSSLPELYKEALIEIAFSNTSNVEKPSHDSIAPLPKSERIYVSFIPSKVGTNDNHLQIQIDLSSAKWGGGIQRTCGGAVIKTVVLNMNSQNGKKYIENWKQDAKSALVKKLTLNVGVRGCAVGVNSPWAVIDTLILTGN